MSVDVTLDDALEGLGSLKEKFVLTEKDVNGFKIEDDVEKNDTAKFTKEYLIPYIFSDYTDAFRNKSREPRGG